MAYQPENLKRWSLPSCYAGAEWREYFSSGIGQSQASDALERSNFVCMLEALGGETETVVIVRESHWVVGWVEWIAIHQDDDKALERADAIKAKLEDYPVINEDHWSRVEDEEAQEVWTHCYSARERVEYIRKHRSQFEFHDMRDLLGCVRGEYFAGYASELLY